MELFQVSNYKGSNPTGQAISEKLDGVRSVWTGAEFLTKNGNKLHPPAWFTSGLPLDLIEGELWLGRGKFNALNGAVKRKGYGWDGITFNVFDTPNGDSWEQRQEHIKTLDLPEHVNIVKQTICLSKAHLLNEYNALIKLGAEGVVIRQTEAEYQAKAQRLVPAFQDEAVVTGYNEGTGRFKGLVGSLSVSFNSVEFNVGTGLTESLRHLPPSIGSLVTFKFKGLSERGVPRQPVFVAVRDYE